MFSVPTLSFCTVVALLRDEKKPMAAMMTNDTDIQIIPTIWDL